MKHASERTANHGTHPTRPAFESRDPTASPTGAAPPDLQARQGGVRWRAAQPDLLGGGRGAAVARRAVPGPCAVPAPGQLPAQLQLPPSSSHNQISPRAPSPHRHSRREGAGSVRLRLAAAQLPRRGWQGFCRGPRRRKGGLHRWRRGLGVGAVAAPGVAVSGGNRRRHRRGRRRRGRGAGAALRASSGGLWARVGHPRGGAVAEGRARPQGGRKVSYPPCLGRNVSYPSCSQALSPSPSARWAAWWAARLAPRRRRRLAWQARPAVHVAGPLPPAAEPPESLPPRRPAPPPPQRRRCRQSGRCCCCWVETAAVAARGVASWMSQMLRRASLREWGHVRGVREKKGRRGDTQALTCSSAMAGAACRRSRPAVAAAAAAAAARVGYNKGCRRKTGGTH